MLHALLIQVHSLTLKSIFGCWVRQSGHIIEADIIDENLEGGLELYPHLYGGLPISAVVEVIPFPCNVDGSFALPEKLKAKVENSEPI